MARLNNRPSRLRSVTPLQTAPLASHSLSDQENMDPAPRDKGKQRAVETEETDTTIDSSRKRRRVEASTSTPSQAEEDDESEQEERKFTKYFDPNQAPETQRNIKRQFRALDRNVHERRDDLLRDNGDGLRDTVVQADNIFKDVKQTGDATMDSRLLVNVSDLASKRTAALLSGDRNVGIDVDGFLSKCLAYMRGDSQSSLQNGRQRQTQNRDNNDSSDEDEDDSGGPLDWHFLGRHACCPYNSRPPVPTFLLGPLSLEKKKRATTERRKRTTDNAHETRPEALTGEDLTQTEQTSLRAQCEMVRKAIKTHIKKAASALRHAGITTQDDAESARGQILMKENRIASIAGLPGVPLFTYVINPNSFGQTIENLFYVSFLIKDGYAGIGMDNDGSPVLYMTDPRSQEEQRAQHVSKHQAILALDYKTWKDLIRSYDIKTSMIPHRQAENASQLGSRGWYG